MHPRTVVGNPSTSRRGGRPKPRRSMGALPQQKGAAQDGDFRDGSSPRRSYRVMSQVSRRAYWLLGCVLLASISCDPATNTSNPLGTGGIGGTAGSPAGAGAGYEQTQPGVAGSCQSVGASGGVGNANATNDPTLVGTKSCNTASITCPQLPPCCMSNEQGHPWLPEVSADGHCYTGVCVPMEQCACTSNADCPYFRQLVCYTAGHCGELVE
jgi:hypothetical protein